MQSALSTPSTPSSSLLHPPWTMAKGKIRDMQTNYPSPSGSYTTDLAPGEISCISWMFPEHAEQTTRLITYCKNNNDFHLKIFSGSTEDANQQGQPWRQLATTCNQAYQILVHAVFEHNHDPELRQAVTTHLTLFVASIKWQFNMYIQHLICYDLNCGASTNQSI